MATPQVSEMEEVNKARADYEEEKRAQRYLMIPGAPK